MADKRTYDLTEQTSFATGDFLLVDKSGNAEAKKISYENAAEGFAGQWADFSLYGVSSTVYSKYCRPNAASPLIVKAKVTDSLTNAIAVTLTTNLTATLQDGIEQPFRVKLQLGVVTGWVDGVAINDSGAIKFVFTPTLGTGTYTIWIDTIIL